jgi:hypothetical protein
MSLVQINIEATDDFGVESVRLLIGGKEVATFLGEAPYTYSWKVKSKFGDSVIISAQASALTQTQDSHHLVAVRFCGHGTGCLCDRWNRGPRALGRRRR